MGAFFDEVPDNCIEWIKEQKVFWVATAPLSGDGTVNVSPKGHDVFHLVSPTTAWYLDITGSGNETISHLSESGNGRLTIMFNAFVGPPRILRLWGKGKAFLRDSPEFNELLPPGDERRLPGSRAIIWIDVERVGTSCGFSVPIMTYEKDRDQLLKFFTPKERSDADFLASQDHLSSSSSEIPTFAPAALNPKGMDAYWALKNAESLDGLPGLRPLEEGAIRKVKGLAVVNGRKGREKVVEKVRKAGRTDWSVELGVAGGLMVGLWIGAGGWERLSEAVGV